MPVTKNLLEIVTKYHLLLERYARRLTGDTAAAPAIAKLALEQYYENRKQIADEQVRQQLKKYTLVYCRFWISCKNKLLKPTHKP